MDRGELMARPDLGTGQRSHGKRVLRCQSSLLRRVNVRKPGIHGIFGYRR
jgi:hypothetical protein